MHEMAARRMGTSGDDKIWLEFMIYDYNTLADWLLSNLSSSLPASKPVTQPYFADWLTTGHPLAIYPFIPFYFLINYFIQI